MPATRRLRRLLRRERFDLVHAHYGLVGWCARLAGARPLLVSFHGTDVRHRLVGPLSRRLAWRVDLVAAVSRALFEPEDGRPGLPASPAPPSCPAAPDLGRFGPLPRARGAARARARRPTAATCSSPPTRPAPRSATTAPPSSPRPASAELLTGGAIEPERMPLWVNAANAVLVTSDYEGFGLAAIEALACDVPVLSTPVGIAPFALAGIAGASAPPSSSTLGAPRRAPSRRRRPPGRGRARAATLSAARMAERTIEAYRDVLASA